MCPRINPLSFSRCELGTPLLKLLSASATTASRNLTPAPRGCKIACKRVLFFDHGWAGYLTYLGPPPLCKQALTRSTLLHKKWKVVVRSSRLLAEFVVTTLEIECVKRKLFLYFHAPRISQVISRLSNLLVLKIRSTLFCAERTYVGPSIV